MAPSSVRTIVKSAYDKVKSCFGGFCAIKPSSAAASDDKTLGQNIKNLFASKHTFFTAVYPKIDDTVTTADIVTIMSPGDG